MCQPAHIASLCNISIFILLLKGVQPTLTTWAQCNVRHSWIRCNVLLTNVVVSLLVSSFHIGVNDWARLHLVRRCPRHFQISSVTLRFYQKCNGTDHLNFWGAGSATQISLNALSVSFLSEILLKNVLTCRSPIRFATKLSTCFLDSPERQPRICERFSL